MYKKSFLILLATTFLIPLFFIPGALLPLNTTKAILVALLMVVLICMFVRESWLEGHVTLPKHLLVYVVVAMPLVYLLSAILATPSSLSLLGYGLEVGTFGFVLLGALVLIFSSVIFVENAKLLQALSVLFLSLLLVALFSALKILVGGDFLAMGIFYSNMGNPLGSWTDLAVAFGLLATFSALVLGMLPLARIPRLLLYVAFALSTILLVVINFSTALWITLVASVILTLYFSKVEKVFFHDSSLDKKGLVGEGNKLLPPIVLVVISLVFLVAPNLNNAVSGIFNIDNTDVRPSLSATLSISKQVLSTSSLLGSGPNTFSNDWLIYKPTSINATPFWSIVFPSGIGFLPTQIATTGILGSTFWLVFIITLLVLAVRAISNIPESRAERFTLVSTLIVSIFLWAAALFYSPSSAMLLLTFLATGLFVASSRESGLVSEVTLNLKQSPQVRTSSALVLASLVLFAIWFGTEVGQKALSTYRFEKAVRLANSGGSLVEVESELNKAVSVSGDDRTFVALSRVNFSIAQGIAESESGTPEEFQVALSKSVQYARSAVAINPAGFNNWVSLGLIYSALVPEPLNIEGAYESALSAFEEARRRNPNSPVLPIYLAQLEINNDNPDKARSHIRTSLALKEDYGEAYVALAKLEIAQGNTLGAIASAERLLTIVPNNPGLHFEIGLLKYSTSNFEGAREAFSNAVTLYPEYANAKYYLALSLVQLDQAEEARTHLEELRLTNPDNAELRALLESLE